MCPPDGDLGLVPALALATALAGGCTPAGPKPQPSVQVAAASDLSVAFEELGRLFEARTGHTVTFSFAASGALAQQLSQGAPYDLFAAASGAFVDRAVQSGACDGSSKALYARGHLVAWSKAGVRLETLSDLRQREIAHIAIASPEHAPYGTAAREALTSAGLWAELAPKIVQAENVRQALQFAETGNADVALVARSLIVPQSTGQKLAIDPALYQPLEQTLVVCRHGNNLEGGRAFAKLIESAEGQALLRRYGFGGTSAERGE